MAEQLTLLDFEEGSPGVAIDPAAAIHKPPKWDETDSTLTILDATYDSDAHSGTLAAHMAVGAGRLTVIGSSSRASGGGGWFKSIEPPSFAGDPIASVSFFSAFTPLTRSIALYYNGGTLEARAAGAVLVDSIPYVGDQWMHLSLAPSGAWSLTDASSIPLMSGSMTAAADSPYDSFVFFAQSGSTPGELLVDDVWLWWRGDGPVVRLYPRDDGRGMSSAPRIWPPTKANRIIGGYQ